MSSIISFKDIDISSQGTIACSVYRDGQESEFYIRLPYSFQPQSDLVAATFVTIVGNFFEQIHLDLPVGPELRRRMENWTGSRVVTRPGVDYRRKPTGGSALNFSGGFDSLAADVLKPNAHLISLDFGGRFSRERKFYERFDPLIIETNLVDLGLNRYSWTFMGIGSLLMRDELNIGSYSFGSIMAETAHRLSVRPMNQQTSGLPLAEHFGMRVANPVAGLSEIAAMKLVAQTRPGQLIDILNSVALPQEEKFLRKYQMLTTVLHELGLNVHLPSDLPQRPRGMEWGLSRASDLSSLYTMTVLGTDAVLALYPGGVPTRFVEFAQQGNMNFMNRINPHAYAGTDPHELAQWYKKLIEHGIYPFERADWDAMETTMELFEEK
jgi:hypothetical protein